MSPNFWPPDAAEEVWSGLFGRFRGRKSGLHGRLLAHHGPNAIALDWTERGDWLSSVERRSAHNKITTGSVQRPLRPVPLTNGSASIRRRHPSTVRCGMPAALATARSQTRRTSVPARLPGERDARRGVDDEAARGRDLLRHANITPLLWAFVQGQSENAVAERLAAGARGPLAHAISFGGHEPRLRASSIGVSYACREQRPSFRPSSPAASLHRRTTISEGACAGRGCRRRMDEPPFRTSVI